MDFFTGSHDAGTIGLGLLIAGAVAGLMAGAFGRGAGLILVPVLYHLAGEMGVAEAIRFNLAAGTSLLCLLPLSLYKAAAFSGGIPRADVKRWAPMLLMGLVLGIGLAVFLPPKLRAILFAVMAILIAAATLWPKKTAEALENGLRLRITAAQGMIGTLMGTSGVSLVLSSEAVPSAKTAEISAWFAAIPITALGAAAAVITGWDMAGLPKYSYGFVNLLAFGIAAPVLFATAALSARYADIIEAKRSRAAFALIVLTLAGKMLWEVMG